MWVKAHRVEQYLGLIWCSVAIIGVIVAPVTWEITMMMLVLLIGASTAGTSTCSEAVHIRIHGLQPLCLCTEDGEVIQLNSIHSEVLFRGVILCTDSCLGRRLWWISSRSLAQREWRRCKRDFIIKVAAHRG